MGEAFLVRRPALQRDRGDERRLEPAAVLVGGFEVQVGLPLDAHHLVNHGEPAHAGIDPHVERVVAAGRAGREVERVVDRRVVGVEPDVRAVLGDEVGDLVDELGVEDRLVVGVVERGQRHTPTALARDAPVGPRFDRAVDAVAAPVRNPFHLVDGAQDLGTQFVHADEELVHRAEDDRHLGTPAVRVGVMDLALARQRADAFEHGDDVRVGVEDVLADQLGHATFLGEAAVVVDRREHGQDRTCGR